MPFDEDLSLFFDDVDEATYKGTMIYGDFQNEYFESNGIESRELHFVCPADSVPGVLNGDHITINNVIYIIRTPEPDGTGVIRLKLQVAK